MTPRVSNSVPDPPSVFRALPGLRAVISGCGCVGQRLAGEIDAQGSARPLIVCGANLAKSPVLTEVKRALDPSIAVFDGSRPHTPHETVDRGAAAARAARADAIIAVGGSSAVDCAKGIAVLLASEREQVNELTPLSWSRLFETPVENHGVVPLLVISTTLSFAEFLPFWGVRRSDQLRKVPYGDLGCVERTVFLDGEMAAHTPDEIWFQTGVKALDDAFSAYCRGAGPEPFLDPILREAIAGLVQQLPLSRGRGCAQTRQQILTSCWMTKFMLPRLLPVTVAAWLSTAARHSIGAVCEAPHGAASCVALPEALRFHAGETRLRQAELASFLGWDGGGEAPLAGGLEGWLRELGTPRQLSDLGIDRGAVPEIVAAMREESPSLGSEPALRAAVERML